MFQVIDAVGWFGQGFCNSFLSMVSVIPGVRKVEQEMNSFQISGQGWLVCVVYTRLESSWKLKNFWMQRRYKIMNTVLDRIRSRLCNRCCWSPEFLKGLCSVSPHFKNATLVFFVLGLVPNEDENLPRGYKHGRDCKGKIWNHIFEEVQVSPEQWKNGITENVPVIDAVGWFGQGFCNSFLSMVSVIPGVRKVEREMNSFQISWQGDSFVSYIPGWSPLGNWKKFECSAETK